MTLQRVPLQDKGLDEAFWPILQMDEPPEKKGVSHWVSRVLFALAACLALWGLYFYVPAKGACAAHC